jgi:hypothetical protein
LSITLPVDGWPDDDQAVIAMFERIDQALALLEASLPLGDESGQERAEYGG